jgi:hypothetical protein
MMADELDKFRPLDMTLDERLDEYLEWVNDSFDKTLVTDAKSEIERLRDALREIANLPGGEGKMATILANIALNK